MRYQQNNRLLSLLLVVQVYSANIIRYDFVRFGNRHSSGAANCKLRGGECMFSLYCSMRNGTYIYNEKQVIIYCTEKLLIKACCRLPEGYTSTSSTRRPSTSSTLSHQSSTSPASTPQTFDWPPTRLSTWIPNTKSTKKPTSSHSITTSITVTSQNVTNKYDGSKPPTSSYSSSSSPTTTNAEVSQSTSGAVIPNSGLEFSTEPSSEHVTPNQTSASSTLTTAPSMIDPETHSTLMPTKKSTPVVPHTKTTESSTKPTPIPKTIVPPLKTTRLPATIPTFPPTSRPTTKSTSSPAQTSASVTQSTTTSTTQSSKTASTTQTTASTTHSTTASTTPQTTASTTQSTTASTTPPPTTVSSTQSTTASTTETTTKPTKKSTTGFTTRSTTVPSKPTKNPTTKKPIKPVGPKYTYKDVCGLHAVSPTARIVGGKPAQYARHPWLISLRQRSDGIFKHKCGAALVTKNWAITAAHCVQDIKVSDLLLRIGEHDTSHTNEAYEHVERRVKLVVQHQLFDPRTYEYDLALVRLAEKVEFKKNILPVCLPKREHGFIGMEGIVAGWGRLYEGGPPPPALHEVKVPVITNAECEAMYLKAGYREYIPNIFLCAGFEKGERDSCEGDSGGPLVIKKDGRYTLAGIISWGIGCAARNQPGVYTNVRRFLGWITPFINID